VVLLCGGDASRRAVRENSHALPPGCVTPTLELGAPKARRGANPATRAGRPLSAESTGEVPLAVGDSQRHERCCHCGALLFIVGA
jgi:hypothetical protein